MENVTDLMTATRAVIDPTTSAADLAQIVQAQPSLWPQIAGHPNAYPELLAWLNAKGDATTKQAIAARQAAVPQAIGASSPLPPPAAQVSAPPATMIPAAHTRSKRPWAISGIAAVIVVVAIVVLTIIKPWQSSGTAPTLTLRQAATMYVNNPILFGTTNQSASDFEQYLQVTGDPLDFCGMASDLGFTLTGVLGCDGGNDDAFGSGMFFVFDTPDNARLWGTTLLRGMPQDEGPLTLNGVWMWLRSWSPTPGALRSTAVTQYGNVVIYAEEGDSTWQQWQTNSAMLKKAVDQAAKS